MTGTPHFRYRYVPHYAGMSSREKVYEIWQFAFDGAYADGDFLCMVMPPQGIGRGSRVAMLEHLM